MFSWCIGFVCFLLLLVSAAYKEFQYNRDSNFRSIMRQCFKEQLFKFDLYMFLSISNISHLTSKTLLFLRKHIYHTILAEIKNAFYFGVKQFEILTIISIKRFKVCMLWTNLIIFKLFYSGRRAVALFFLFVCLFVFLFFFFFFFFFVLFFFCLFVCLFFCFFFVVFFQHITYSANHNRRLLTISTVKWWKTW